MYVCSEDIHCVGYSSIFIARKRTRRAKKKKNGIISSTEIFKMSVTLQGVNNIVSVNFQSGVVLICKHVSCKWSSIIYLSKWDFWVLSLEREREKKNKLSFNFLAFNKDSHRDCFTWYMHLQFSAPAFGLLYVINFHLLPLVFVDGKILHSRYFHVLMILMCTQF